MKDLISRARGGDAEAFQALILAHEQSLYKVARSFLRQEMDIEDAVSQTILDCWEKLPTLRKPAYFKTWLTRILINNCKDVIRERARLIVLGAVPEPEPEEDEHSGIYFEELMACLPAALRPAMQLYYGEGYKAREVAALLDIPVGTVTAQLKRGREYLEEAHRKGEITL